MQYVDRYCDFIFLLVASNDNEDLLSLPYPADELALIQEIKSIMRMDNEQTGVLLKSQKERAFFQELIDAERYILLRYFTFSVPKEVLSSLKRHILDTYLSPNRRNRNRKR